MTLIIFLFFLGLLIIIHELGHFLTAKRVDAVVEEFSVGFPPRIFSKKFKGTTYSLGLILFGGFVKLKGEDDPNDKEGFLFLPAKKRLFIVLAGVFFNILLAYFLFSLSLLSGYPVESNKIFISGFLDKNSIAGQKFKVGDEILSIKFNNQIYQFNNLKDLFQFLKARRGHEVEIIFQRNQQVLQEKITLPAGFYLSNFTLVKEPFPKNFLLAFTKTIENFKKIIVGFYKTISSLLTKEKIDLEIVGPVGIYNLFDYFKNFGLGYIFYFTAVLSLNLALINALPFPALDGGRAIFILSEILFRKKLSYHKEELIHKVGFLFLFSLLFLVTLKDIYKLWFK